MKEILSRWAERTSCPGGGNWVVVWQSQTDYRIDAPLVLSGSFESMLTQLFDLYKKAETPLYAEASRLQCVVSVNDKPTGRR